jgi:hypothetical protein
MSYGDPTTPGAHEWSLREDEAQPFFRQAIDYVDLYRTPPTCWR